MLVVKHLLVLIVHINQYTRFPALACGRATLGASNQSSMKAWAPEPNVQDPGSATAVMPRPATHPIAVTPVVLPLKLFLSPRGDRKGLSVLCSVGHDGLGLEM